MKKILWISFIALGILFILNAIFGRYIVLPGYIESLKSGANGMPENVTALKIFRFLLWAFSYKLGICFFILGVMIKNIFCKKDIYIFSIVSFIYIAFAYMPLEFYSSLFFGIQGCLITIVALYIIILMPKTNMTNKNNVFMYLAFFFVLMAFYNICPFMGTRCFALQPQKMIEYNLLPDAYSFANHIMIEFSLAAIFLLFAKIKNKRTK